MYLSRSGEHLSTIGIMLRQPLITVLLLGVVFLGSDAQALACELSCATEAHQSQHGSAHRHSHPDAVSELGNLQPHAHAAQREASDDFTFVADQHVSRPLPTCAASDRVTLSAQVIVQLNTLSCSAAVVNNSMSADRLLAHHSPTEFESPPCISFAPNNSSPLRI